jgi:hypothetical protein
MVILPEYQNKFIMNDSDRLLMTGGLMLLVKLKLVIQMSQQPMAEILKYDA